MTPQSPLSEWTSESAMAARYAAAVARIPESERSAALTRAVASDLKSGRHVIKQQFLASNDGPACAAAYADLMDGIIGGLARVAAEQVLQLYNPTVGERIAIIAVGGYGRGELAPHSDIDLLFVMPYKRAPVTEQLVETILYTLWDLGLKVGHAVRSVDEAVRAAKTDITIRTANLEMRRLWGDDALVDTFEQRLRDEVLEGNGPGFVTAKLAERDERHGKLGDSRYVLEPNVKEGKGGLRDLHTLAWIAHHLYGVAADRKALIKAGLLTSAEARDFFKAQEFLMTVRCHLHYLVGRAEERLTFDVQPEIARALNYQGRNANLAVERFMKHYFLTAKRVGDLTRLFCAGMELEAQSRRRGIAFLPGRLVKGLGFGGSSVRRVDGFLLDRGWLSVDDPDHFKQAPHDILRVFRVAQQRSLDLHPDTVRHIRRSLKVIDKTFRSDTAANRTFLEVLTDPERDPAAALRQMNEAGVLGRFVPDFGRVVCQMQYDMYHVYTTDAHTIFALKLLFQLERGDLSDELPLATRLMGKIASRRALYLALFCHDIAKGRGGDHSILGAKVAERLGKRFALEPEEIETAAWLVRWHLLMSDVAFKRDLEDDKAIADFTAQVESPERLRLLTILTCIDIRAVGPDRWNGWKATLMSQLYDRSRALLVQGMDTETRDQRVAAVQNAVMEQLADAGWAEADRDRLLNLGYPPYWLAFDIATLVRQAALLRAAWREDRPLTLDTRVDLGAGMTEVTIHTQDHPGLFARLTGALTLAGADILEAKVFTLASGMTVDVFLVADAAEGGALARPEKLARLAVTVERCLSGSLRPAEELAKRKPALASRTNVFKVTPRVLIDNQASGTRTIVEINARNRPGLLFDIAKAFNAANVQIQTAKISTFGERAIDVFYIKDVFGLKITHRTKLATIKKQVLEALEPPSEKGEAG